MKVLKITKENTQFQIINALKTNREKRNRQGFLFEGVRNINNAVKYCWKIKAFFYSSKRSFRLGKGYFKTVSSRNAV